MSEVPGEGFRWGGIVACVATDILCFDLGATSFVFDADADAEGRRRRALAATRDRLATRSGRRAAVGCCRGPGKRITP